MKRTKILWLGIIVILWLAAVGMTTWNSKAPGSATAENPFGGETHHQSHGATRSW